MSSSRDGFKFAMLFIYLLAEGRPSVDFCSRVAFPNRETLNEIKTILEFISTVDCTLSNERLHQKYMLSL